MTPHRALFHDYKPHKCSIHLANGSTIYSEGIGSILFIPLINGTKSRPVLFSEVLHVPSLSNNLLSVLSIVSRRNIVVTIQNRSMLFSLNNETLFEAEITPHNATFLLGEKLTPSESCMAAISTLPPLLSLWHQRFANHSIPYVKQLISKKLVQGLYIEPAASNDLDPICEPCLAGKMNGSPFSSSSSRASQPLELVHSDLHQLKSPTWDGYKYWITFIDDSTHFAVVILLKAKSQALLAFQHFKSFAENRTKRKIMSL